VEVNSPFPQKFFLKVRKSFPGFLKQQLGFLDDLVAELEEGGVGVFAGTGEVNYVRGLFAARQFSFEDNDPYP
jgi:hypothetical protein